jgi:hypothetical protein
LLISYHGGICLQSSFIATWRSLLQGSEFSLIIMFAKTNRYEALMTKKLAIFLFELLKIPTVLYFLELISDRKALE